MSLTALIAHSLHSLTTINVPAFPRLPLPYLRHQSWSGLIHLGVTAGFCVIAVTCVARYSRTFSTRSIALTMTALLWSVSLFFPQYILWIAPFMAGVGAWAVYAWWFGAVTLVVYYYAAFANPYATSDNAWGILPPLVYLAAPIAIALAWRYRADLRRLVLKIANKCSPTAPR